VALGSQAFLAKVKEWVGRVTKEQPDRERKGLSLLSSATSHNRAPVFILESFI
jgi:hypothetical protein